MINEKMKWIVCTRCDRGVPPEYLQAHLWAKHEIDCSDDTLNTIITGRELKSLTSLKTWKKNTVALEAVIGGIATEKGHKCIECGHCTPKWGSMTDHFLKHLPSIIPWIPREPAPNPAFTTQILAGLN
jgi:hypothetical protein